MYWSCFCTLFSLATASQFPYAVPWFTPSLSPSLNSPFKLLPISLNKEETLLMAGLSVILESHSKLPKYPQILSKTSLILTPKMSKSFSPNSHYAPFLERCFLCNRKLLQGNDIFMYRGDRAFCSEECRSKQIFKDEESVTARDSCSLAAAEAQRCLKSLPTF